MRSRSHAKKSAPGNKKVGKSRRQTLWITSKILQMYIAFSLLFSHPSRLIGSFEAFVCFRIRLVASTDLVVSLY